jgi:hypothetical protein
MTLDREILICLYDLFNDRNLARLWPIRRLSRARKSSIVEGPVRVLAFSAGAGT